MREILADLFGNLRLPQQIDAVDDSSSAKWRRDSAVILDIEPPSGERVIKYLMASQ